MSAIRHPVMNAPRLHVTAALLAAIWLLSEAKILWPTETVGLTSAIVMGLFLVLSILAGRRATQTLAMILLLTAVGLAYVYGAWAALRNGLERAVLFAALLPTLSLLRIALQRDTRIEGFRHKIEAVKRAERPVWILSGSYVTASLLSVGSISVFAALLPVDATEEKRLQDAQASVCGASLAILWSPFFFALALVTEYLPSLSLAALIASGLLLSAAGIALAFRVYGAQERLQAALAAMTALREFVLPITIVTLALVAVRTMTGFSTIETMLLVLPVLCVLLLATPPQQAFRHIFGDVWARLCKIQDEAAIVGSAVVFGTVLTSVPWMQSISSPDALAGIPAPLLVFGCIGFMIGTGFLGFLPLVTGTISLVVLTGIPNSLNDLAIGLSVLAGWSLASMSSMSSMMVLVAAGQYDLRPEQIVRGRNLRFLLVFVPLSGLAILLLTQIT